MLRNLLLVVACFLVIFSLPKDPDPPITETIETVVVADGDTLWYYARVWGPDYDPRHYIDRVKELNSWDKIPLIHPGQVINIPDWRYH